MGRRGFGSLHASSSSCFGSQPDKPRKKSRRSEKNLNEELTAVPRLCGGWGGMDRWYRPRATKKMTVELVQDAPGQGAFQWPEPPTDLTPFVSPPLPSHQFPTQLTPPPAGAKKPTIYDSRKGKRIKSGTRSTQRSLSAPLSIPPPWASRRGRCGAGTRCGGLGGWIGALWGGGGGLMVGREVGGDERDFCFGGVGGGGGRRGL